jgi:hypothetical protein
MQFYRKEAAHTEGLAKIQNLILAGDERQAESACLELVRRQILLPAWDFAEVYSLVNSLRNLRNPSNDFVAVCHVCGLYMALWRGYGGISALLIRALKKLNIAWLQPKMNELTVVAGMIRKEEVSTGKGKMVHAGGSTVRSHGSGIVPIDMHAVMRVSICNGEKICGNAFCLEDGKSMMSEDEALMWFEVTPYSPLESHGRLCPF